MGVESGSSVRTVLTDWQPQDVLAIRCAAADLTDRYRHLCQFFSPFVLLLVSICSHEADRYVAASRHQPWTPCNGIYISGSPRPLELLYVLRPAERPMDFRFLSQVPNPTDPVDSQQVDDRYISVVAVHQVELI
jgi:hypothetical protein